MDISKSSIRIFVTDSEDKEYQKTIVELDSDVSKVTIELVSGKKFTFGIPDKYNKCSKYSGIGDRDVEALKKMFNMG